MNETTDYAIYRQFPDYKERRQWALLEAASRIYAYHRRDDPGEYRECVLEAASLLAEIQNIESGTE